MEAVANSVDDALIDSLGSKLSNSAGDSTDRKIVTFWLAGSNIYENKLRHSSSLRFDTRQSVRGKHCKVIVESCK